MYPIYHPITPHSPEITIWCSMAWHNSPCWPWSAPRRGCAGTSRPAGPWRIALIYPDSFPYIIYIYIYVYQPFTRSDGPPFPACGLPGRCRNIATKRFGGDWSRGLGTLEAFMAWRLRLNHVSRSKDRDSPWHIYYIIYIYIHIYIYYSIHVSTYIHMYK